MQKNKTERRIALFGNLKVLVFAALLCAISGVMKLIAPSGDTWRISLENFPIIFAGITFGPWIGGIVGIGADLLGCLFRGYAINPFITMASMLAGFLSGLFLMLFNNRKTVISIASSTLYAHIVANVLTKTVVLSLTYGMPAEVLLAERSVTYLITAAVESIIIIVLYKNKAIKNGLKRVIGNDEL